MVDIIMATYNAEKYVKEQLESIINQNVANWRLIIRDDCSTDSTWEILTEYESKYPQHIELHRAEVNSGSAKNNFLYMLKYIKYKYVMLCDQDDIWSPNKIEIMQRKMLELESVSGEVPLLVHSDAVVVNQKRKLIAPSLSRFQCLNPSADKLHNLLVQNIVTGCAVMMNKSLTDMVKISDNIVIHDWWLALIACCFGKIAFIEEPLLEYRQHANNSVGAKNNTSIIGALLRAINNKKIKASISNSYKQARDFLNMYSDSLSEEQKEIINKYLKIPSLPKFKRIRSLFDNGFQKNGVLPKIGQILYI